MATGATLRLRQLQVLHRHGDRTPLRNVFKGDPLAEFEECKRWAPKLPSADDVAQLRSVAAVVDFAKAADASGSAKPYQTRPFGYLTTTGIEQMTARGDKVRSFCVDEALSMDSLTDRDVHIFSNSYTRTQLSVQALLRGLLHGKPRITPRVHVLPPDHDMINTYAAFPEIATLKAALEHENEEFAFREHEMAPRKAELTRALPMFASGSQPFTWMAAADYFVCRDAHGVSMIPGTEAHCDASVLHLSFRFHQFYSHPRVLQLVAGRLMQHVLLEIQKVTTNDPAMKKLVIYSGHDISILSVLHAINATLADDDKWWPEYASAVALELLEDDDGRWYVRARLNDTILNLRGGSSDASTLYSCEEFYHLIMDKFQGFEH
uniref:Histidine acid phosphatase n=1 Tax=Globisporangium ultimum (strain ATCC 200006 / CBS 805.95 / DAOM BR144) TaxID=431595 RepID=K3W775_GLOUD